MQINDLKRDHKNKTSIKVGRGGKRGKTSGKGMKGQKARTGNSTRPAMRDIIKKIPKLRGHGIHGNKNREILNKYLAINVGQLDVFSDGDIVNAKTLHEKGLLDMKKGKLPRVKILANGNISKKVKIEKLLISESAKAKVEEAGGSVEMI